MKAKTASRRVLGWMTELTFQIGYRIPPGGLMDVDTISLNRHPQRIPHLTDGGFFTIDRVRDRAGLDRERPLWRYGAAKRRATHIRRRPASPVIHKAPCPPTGVKCRSPELLP